MALCVLFACHGTTVPRAGDGARPRSPPGSEVEPVGVAHALKGLLALRSAAHEEAAKQLQLAIVHNRESPFLWRKLVQAWLRRGENQRARAVIEKALQRFPLDPAILAQASDLSYADEDYVASWRQAARVSVTGEGTQWERRALPLRLDASLWLLPEAPTAAGDASFPWLEPALARHATDVDLRRNIAAVFEDHGRLGYASTHYEKHTRLHPGDIAAVTGLARVLELRGLYTEASAPLVRLLRHYPQSAAIYDEIYRLQTLGGDSHSAAHFRALAMGDQVQQPEGSLAIAISDFSLGRGRSAIEDLRRVLTNIAVPNNDGPVLDAVLLGRWSELFERYPQVFTPQEARLFVTDCRRYARILGGGSFEARCLAATGNSRAALRHLNRTIESGLSTSRQVPLGLAALGAKFAAAHRSERRARRQWFRLLGSLRERYGLTESEIAGAWLALEDALGNGKGALEWVNKLVALEPGDLSIALRHADIVARYQGAAMALEPLRVLWREDPLDPQRLSALGYTIAESIVDSEGSPAGRQAALRQAEVYLRRAARLSSGDGFIADSLGWVLHQRGQDEAAVRSLRRALRFTPPDAEVWGHMAAVRASLGEYPQAYCAYRTALRLLPRRDLIESLARQLVEVEKRLTNSSGPGPYAAPECQVVEGS